MPSPTFAEQQVERIKLALAKAVGIESASVGGNSVKYKDKLESELVWWEKRVAIEKGTFKRSRQIYLGAD